MQILRNEAELTFEQRRHPRLYNLDFDVIITCGKEAVLLDLIERVARFYQLFPELRVAGHGALGITELVPLGGLKRVNLSNMRQASGKCRIDGCPIFDGSVSGGRLATGLRLDLSI
jgi:hypothetical protein